MKLRLTLTIEVPNVTDEGDADSHDTLHSLARDYYLYQYGDASDLTSLSGAEAIEACIIETIGNEGLFAYHGLPGRAVVDSHVEVVP